jgi:hypothetical protein
VRAPEQKHNLGDEMKVTTKQEAVKQLDKIVDILNEGTLTSRSLWSILSALRGPDNEDPFVKGKTTSKVRGAIGLRHYAVSASVNNEALESDPEFTVGEKVQTHFEYHYKSAYAALRDLKIINEKGEHTHDLERKFGKQRTK